MGMNIEYMHMQCIHCATENVLLLNSSACIWFLLQHRLHCSMRPQLRMTVCLRSHELVVASNIISMILYELPTISWNWYQHLMTCIQKKWIFWEYFCTIENGFIWISVFRKSVKCDKCDIFDCLRLSATNLKIKLLPIKVDWTWLICLKQSHHSKASKFIGWLALSSQSQIFHKT